MKEEPSDSESDPPKDEDAKPSLTPAERVFVRLTMWQTVLSVAGIFIAIVALYAALGESAAVRQQTAASVWPFVQLIIEDHEGATEARFAMSFANAGVGPARMQSIRLVMTGETIRDWQQAVEKLGGKATAMVSRNFVNKRVIRPDETIDLISTMDPELVRGFQAAVAHPESSITYCYCSIFDECWLADSRKDVQAPEAVSQCPDFGDSAYRN